MRSIVLALSVGLATLGLTGTASAAGHGGGHGHSHGHTSYHSRTVHHGYASGGYYSTYRPTYPAYQSCAPIYTCPQTRVIHGRRFCL